MKREEKERERESALLMTFSLSRQHRSSLEVYERGREALSLVDITVGFRGQGIGAGGGY